MIEASSTARASLNVWFQQRAWTNHSSGISRTNVICVAETNEIVGYVTLSAAQIERAFLPKPLQRNKPDPVPVTALGQLAIHKDYQGRGHARSLLLFALRTAARASREIGSFGVITHPVDEEVRAVYRRWGFVDVPFDPRRAMIVRMADLEKSGIA
jgi:ribosomal protein S18 acetylase RimI-like enzyme